MEAEQPPVVEEQPTEDTPAEDAPAETEAPAEEMQPADEPAEIDVVADGLYLAFHGNDGDAIDFAYAVSLSSLLTDPARGELPMAIKVNPYWIDLFPTLYAWHTEQAGGPIDLVVSMNDGGAGNTAEGEAGWRRQLAHYLDHANGSLRIANYFGPFDAGRGRVMGSFADLGINHVFRAYQGFRGQPMRWATRNGCVHSNMVGTANATPVETAEQVRQAVAQVPAGEPAFVLVRLGVDPDRDLNARRGSYAFTMAQEVIDALEAEPPVGRTIHLVPIRDLAHAAGQHASP